MQVVFLVLGRDVKKAVNSKGKEYFIIDIFQNCQHMVVIESRLTFNWFQVLILLLKCQQNINFFAVCTVTNCSLLPPPHQHLSLLLITGTSQVSVFIRNTRVSSIIKSYFSQQTKERNCLLCQSHYVFQIIRSTTCVTQLWIHIETKHHL